MVSYFVQTHPLGTDAEPLDMVGTIEDTTHWDREEFHTQYGSLEATQVLYFGEGSHETILILEVYSQVITSCQSGGIACRGCIM